MKLAQLCEQDTIETKVLAWAKQLNKLFTTSDRVETLADGSIVYHGDIDTLHPMKDVTFYEVTGAYILNLSEAFNNFPKLVGGTFEIHWKDNITHHVKASEIPKMSGKKGQYSARMLLDGGTSQTIELDDITSLKTYADVSLGFGVVGGLNKISQLGNLKLIRIKDSYEGIPSTLPELSAIIFDFEDGTKLRGLHKALKSFTASIFMIRSHSAFPALLLLKSSYKAQSATFDLRGGATARETNKLYEIIASARKEGKDILEVQEELIDAGLPEFAKM